MAVEAPTSFLPELVTAVSGCVKSVSEKCQAKGLIPECVHDEVLELGATSKDKARTLVLAVKKSTETDERCFELFLNILEQELPFASRDRLLNDIRKEANEKANSCTALVPSSRNVQQIPREELPRESVILQKSLLEKLEEASRKHQSACDEKKYSEERLKVKTEECEELRRALETQTQKPSTDLDDVKRQIFSAAYLAGEPIKKSSELKSPAEGENRIPELKDLMIELKCIASNWQNFGVMLGIDYRQLDAVAADHQGVENRLREMLKIWLKNMSPYPTWLAVVKALEHIDERRLAGDIRARWCGVS